MLESASNSAGSVRHPDGAPAEDGEIHRALYGSEWSHEPINDDEHSDVSPSTTTGKEI